eukprot:scaffold10576_cov115-Isochrysis_galbana.AAC.5
MVPTERTEWTPSTTPSTPSFHALNHASFRARRLARPSSPTSARMSESPFKDCINKISGPAPVDPSNLCKQASADNKNLFQLISGPINIGNSFKCFCKVGKTGSPVEVLPINCSPVKTPFDSQTAVDDFGSNAQLSLPSLFS